MDTANPFAEITSTPEPIIGHLRRQLRDDPVVSRRAEPAELDALAEAAVRELWDAPVKTFVPVLALRSVREGLLAVDRPPIGSAAVAATRPARAPPRWGDATSTEGDELLHEPTDRLLH